MEEYGLRGFENKVLRNIAGGITGGGGGVLLQRVFEFFFFLYIFLETLKK